MKKIANDSQLLDRKRLNSMDDVNYSPYKKRATPDRMMYPNSNSNSNSIHSPLVNGKMPYNRYNQPIQQNPNIPINPYQNSNNNMRMSTNQMNYPYQNNQQGYQNYPNQNSFNNSNPLNTPNNYTNDVRNNNTNLVEPKQSIDGNIYLNLLYIYIYIYIIPLLFTIFNYNNDIKFLFYFILFKLNYKNQKDIKKKLKHSLYLSSPPNVEIAEHLKLYHSDKYLEFIKNRKEKVYIYIYIV